MITQEQLKEVLHYDPETGVFTRTKKTVGGVKKYPIAGHVNKSKGYREIFANGKLYRAGRLAWLYIEGYWPEHQIDHINRIKDDDRWSNLRHVSHQCNMRNSKVNIKNTSGIKGVSWSKKAQKWVAYIQVVPHYSHLGFFISKKDAAQARWEAEVEHGYPNCNTTSSAYQYLQSMSHKRFNIRAINR